MAATFPDGLSSPPRVRLALLPEPAIEFLAAYPDAATDPNRRNLPAADQLVRPATRDPQDLRKDMNVMIEDGNITGYKVNLEVTFVLEE